MRPALRDGAVGVLAATAFLVGCANDEGAATPASTPPSPTPPSSTPPSSTPPSSTPPSSTPPSPTPETEEDQRRIALTAGSARLTATLDDSAASRDLLAQLPVTIDMRDHGGVEKTGRLPSPLSLEGQPDGADPPVGAVGYYAPGNDLVLYHGDQSFFAGIVVLGSLDGDGPGRVGAIDGAVTVEALGG